MGWKKHVFHVIVSYISIWEFLSEWLSQTDSKEKEKSVADLLEVIYSVVIKLDFVVDEICGWLSVDFLVLNAVMCPGIVFKDIKIVILKAYYQEPMGLFHLTKTVAGSVGLAVLFVVFVQFYQAILQKISDEDGNDQTFYFETTNIPALPPPPSYDTFDTWTSTLYIRSGNSRSAKEGQEEMSVELMLYSQMLLSSRETTALFREVFQQSRFLESSSLCVTCLERFQEQGWVFRQDLLLCFQKNRNLLRRNTITSLIDGPANCIIESDRLTSRQCRILRIIVHIIHHPLADIGQSQCSLTLAGVPTQPCPGALRCVNTSLLRDRARLQIRSKVVIEAPTPPQPGLMAQTEVSKPRGGPRKTPAIAARRRKEDSMVLPLTPLSTGACTTAAMADGCDEVRAEDWSEDRV